MACGKLLYRDAQRARRVGRHRARGRLPRPRRRLRRAHRRRDGVAQELQDLVSRRALDASRTSASSNGTFVNEVRVQKQALNHADVVRCGTLQVRFVEAAASSRRRRRRQQAAHHVDPGAGQGRCRSIRRCSRRSPAAAAAQPGGADAAEGPGAAQALQERDALAARLREASQELEAATLGTRAIRPSCSGCARRTWPIAIDSPRSAREVAAGRRRSHARHQGRQRAARRARRAQGRAPRRYKQRVEELSDEMQARERQLERAHEDVQRAKQTMEEMRGKLAEVCRRPRTRVGRSSTRASPRSSTCARSSPSRSASSRSGASGLMSLETAVKDLRAEKERTMRELVAAQERARRAARQGDRASSTRSRRSRRSSDGWRACSPTGGGGGGGATTRSTCGWRRSCASSRSSCARPRPSATRFAERLESTERERAELDEQLSQRRHRARVGDAVEGHARRGARARSRRSWPRRRRRAPRRKRRWPAAEKAREAASQTADRAKVDADREKQARGRARDTSSKRDARGAGRGDAGDAGARRSIRSWSTRRRRSRCRRRRACTSSRKRWRALETELAAHGRRRRRRSDGQWRPRGADRRDQEEGGGGVQRHQRCAERAAHQYSVGEGPRRRAWQGGPGPRRGAHARRRHRRLGRSDRRRQGPSARACGK